MFIRIKSMLLKMLAGSAIDSSSLNKLREHHREIWLNKGKKIRGPHGVPLLSPLPLPHQVKSSDQKLFTTFDVLKLEENVLEDGTKWAATSFVTAVEFLFRKAEKNNQLNGFADKPKVELFEMVSVFDFCDSIGQLMKINDWRVKNVAQLLSSSFGINNISISLYLWR